MLTSVVMLSAWYRFLLCEQGAYYVYGFYFFIFLKGVYPGKRFLLSVSLWNGQTVTSVVTVFFKIVFSIKHAQCKHMTRTLFT